MTTNEICKEMKDLFADIYHPQKNTLLTTAKKLLHIGRYIPGYQCKVDTARNSLDIALTVNMTQTHPLALGMPKAEHYHDREESPYMETAVLMHMMWKTRGQRGVIIYPDENCDGLTVEETVRMVCGRVEARLLETYGKMEQLSEILARYQIAETDLRDINDLLRQVSIYKDIDLNVWGHSPLNPKFQNFLAEKKEKAAIEIDP